MTLSENLVRHFYVATADMTDGSYKAVDMSEAAEGSIALALTADKESMYFQHVGKGGVTRSDLIPVNCTLFANATAEEDMEKGLKVATIKLASDIDADGEEDTAVPRGTYIVRVVIHNYVGMSDEDTYIKYGQVTSNGTMTVANFYAALKKSLEKNMSREVVKMFEIGGGESDVTITEVEQPWVLGTMARTDVKFNVELVANDADFEVSKEDNVTTYDWGTVTMSVAEDKLKNSKDIADMEYFYMGERADIYRGKGWPHVIPTQYMVNGASEDGYHTLDLHFAYVGANESCQKSEKTITIVGEGDTGKAVLEALITALEANCPVKVKTSANW